MLQPQEKSRSRETRGRLLQKELQELWPLRHLRDAHSLPLEGHVLYLEWDHRGVAERMLHRLPGFHAHETQLLLRLRQAVDFATELRRKVEEAVKASDGRECHGVVLHRGECREESGDAREVLHFFRVRCGVRTQKELVTPRRCCAEKCHAILLGLHRWLAPVVDLEGTPGHVPRSDQQVMGRDSRPHVLVVVDELHGLDGADVLSHHLQGREVLLDPFGGSRRGVRIELPLALERLVAVRFAMNEKELPALLDHGECPVEYGKVTHSSGVRRVPGIQLHRVDELAIERSPELRRRHLVCEGHRHERAEGEVVRRHCFQDLLPIGEHLAHLDEVPSFRAIRHDDRFGELCRQRRHS